MIKSWEKSAASDKVIDIIIVGLCAMVLFLTLYPFYYVLVISFNEGIDATIGGIYWLPRKFTFENYSKFFTDAKWMKALYISVIRTVSGTLIGVFLTSLISYGLSFRELKYRKFYMTFIIISMYFSGGIIPYYALLQQLGLINKFAVYIVPGAVNAFFLLVGISFFQGISSSLRESAKIDGASEIKVFAKIILPISTPFIATCMLFIGVRHWNNWFDAAFFMYRKDLKTLSFLMMQVINASQVTAMAMDKGASGETTTLSIQAASMIVAVTPIICVYPFLQKYFVTGIMIGSVKE